MTAFFPDGLCEKLWGIYAAKSAQWAALVSQLRRYHRGALLTSRFMGTAVHSKVINRKTAALTATNFVGEACVHAQSLTQKFYGNSSEIIVESTNLIHKAKWLWVMGVHQGFSLMFPKSERKKT